MLSALSLITGEVVAATRADYGSQRRQLLVCPECGEPVHLVERRHPYSTKYFAHPELKIHSGKADCSLRVFGATFRPASSVLTGLHHGQLTDRFQAKVVFEVIKAFGHSAADIRQCALALISSIGTERIAKRGKKVIKDLPAQAFPSWTSRFLQLDHEQEARITEAIEDVALFLSSPYGAQVLAWLSAIAMSIAYCLPRTQLTAKGPRIGVAVGNRNACLAIERYRLRALSREGKEGLPRDGLRDAAEERVLAFLIIHTLVRWRNRNRLLIAAPLIVTDDDVYTLEWEDSAAASASEVTPTTTPVPPYRDVQTKQVPQRVTTPISESLDPSDAHRLAVKEILRSAPDAPSRYDPANWRQPSVAAKTAQVASIPAPIRAVERRNCPHCKRSIGFDVSSKSFYCLNCDLTFARG